MKIFKIQRNADKLFSSGGESPQKFSKRGKMWTALGHVVSHLNYVSDPAALDLTLIEYEIVEEDGSMVVVKKTPIIEVKADASKRKQKITDRNKVRRLKEEIRNAERAREAAEKRLKALQGGARG